jgi:hypothetical protein
VSNIIFSFFKKILNNLQKKLSVLPENKSLNNFEKESFLVFQLSLNKSQKKEEKRFLSFIFLVFSNHFSIIFSIKYNLITNYDNLFILAT